MYKHDIKEYIATAQTIPTNTNADANGGSFYAGETQGALAIKVVVNTAMTIAATKTITIKIQDSADDSSYADFATIYAETAVTTSLTGVVAGTQLGEEFVLPPGIRKYAKINIATDDATAAGKLDIYKRYLAR